MVAWAEGVPAPPAPKLRVTPCMLPEVPDDDWTPFTFAPLLDVEEPIPALFATGLEEEDEEAMPLDVESCAKAGNALTMASARMRRFMTVFFLRVR